MPRTSEQFEEIRETRKQQIKNVALMLFADEGYAHTSISLIARKADISKGLLYNYFSSKEELLTSIMEEGMQAITGSFDPNHDGILTRDEFIYFINESINTMQKDIHFWKLYFSVMMQSSVWKLFENKLADIITPLLRILTEYYRSKGSSNPEAEAILAGALLDGIGFNYVLNPDLFPIEDVKKMLIEKFV